VHFLTRCAAVACRAGASLLTADETTSRLGQFVEERWAKPCDRLQDRAGFVVKALLIRSCFRRSGCSSRVRDARTSTKGWCGPAHPQGPLALADLIGLDTTKGARGSRCKRSSREPIYAPRRRAGANGRRRSARPHDPPVLRLQLKGSTSTMSNTCSTCSDLRGPRRPAGGSPFGRRCEGRPLAAEVDETAASQVA